MALARASGSLFTRLEPQRRRVHAIPLPRRLRAVVEDVPEVRVAAAAHDLGAAHEPAVVRVLGHAALRHRRPEARPAGAGVELRRAVEQRLAAADAAVDAVGLVVPVLAGEGALGALAARHLELLRRQLLAPLGFSLLDVVAHWYTKPFSCIRFIAEADPSISMPPLSCR